MGYRKIHYSYCFSGVADHLLQYPRCWANTVGHDREDWRLGTNTVPAQAVQGWAQPVHLVRGIFSNDAK